MLIFRPRNPPFLHSDPRKSPSFQKIFSAPAFEAVLSHRQLAREALADFHELAVPRKARFTPQFAICHPRKPLFRAGRKREDGVKALSRAVVRQRLCAENDHIAPPSHHFCPEKSSVSPLQMIAFWQKLLWKHGKPRPKRRENRAKMPVLKPKLGAMLRAFCRKRLFCLV